MSKSKTECEKTKTIKNLDELLKEIAKLEKKIAENKGDHYFFRGQANSQWKLNSSWRRSWKAEFDNVDEMDDSQIINMFYENEKLITSYGYEQKTSLEILAEMQHNNIPTFLIDFTTNIYHALWFAFSDNSPNTNDDENDDEYEYVKIFILNNKTNKVENKLDFSMLIKEKVFPNTVFRAPASIKRAITQKSYFICDKKDKNFDIECWRIQKNPKNIKKILAYLFRKGITARTIYPDLLGAYIDTTKNSAITYFFKGLLSDNDNKSIENYTKAIEINGEFKEAYINRGDAYLKKKEWDKAIKDCEKAIDIDSRFKEPYNNLGVAYDGKNESYKAIKNYTKAIEIDDRFKEAYNNRGIIYYKMDEFDKAIKDFDKAIEIDDRYKEAYDGRGIVYLKKKEWDKAIKDFDKAIEIDNGFKAAYNNRGDAYLKKKEWDKAIKDCKKAIDIDSRFKVPYLNLGIAYDGKNESYKAINYFNKAIEIDNGFKAAYINRGNAYEKMNKLDEALQDFKKALKLDPNDKNLKKIIEEIKSKIKEQKNKNNS